MPVKRRATSPVRPSPTKKRQATLDINSNASPAKKQQQTKLTFSSPAKSDSIDRETARPQQSASPIKQDPPNGDHSRLEEKYGIVQREFYPQEISAARCEMYNKNEIPRPIEVLNRALRDTKAAREKVEGGESVVHWFKRDLRLQDNKALSLAAAKAKSRGVPLVCLFIVSPQDYQAHLTSAMRVDFDLRNLAVMKSDLADLDIPLVVETMEQRKDVTKYMLKKCDEWGAKHVYCNIEYEVDELRREARLTRKCSENGIAFEAVHDDVVVPPGDLMSGQGKQYSVYSPWYRAWVRHIHDHPRLLSGFDKPGKNPTTSRQRFGHLFEIPIPEAPANKSLSPEEKERFERLWPAGEHEAQNRLDRFIKDKISAYKETRNLPGENSTSLLSPHFSAGTLAARTAVRRAFEANSTKKLDAGNAGIVSWISEVAWRDFYKHVLAQWPYICMSKPFKYEYADIEWEYDDENFRRWKEGRTGFPIVDAAMRQARYMGYMHNRCRMIVASFLAKDLLIDWRMGERWFMEHLIDGDFASNNGGWGFSASTGVDPQPYFRIFNPLLQSEKFDTDGSYIRRWVEELKDVKGKAVHDPYGRKAGALAEKAGYPRPMVEHAKARQRALDRYRSGLGRSTANVGGGVHN